MQRRLGIGVDGVVRGGAVAVREQRRSEAVGEFAGTFPRVRCEVGHFGALDSRLDFRGLPTPFPFTLALPQERTEAFLESQALDLGARVLRGHEVTGFTERPDRSACTSTAPTDRAT